MLGGSAMTFFELVLICLSVAAFVATLCLEDD